MPPLSQQINALCTYYEQQIANNPPPGAEHWSDSKWLKYLCDEAMRRSKQISADDVIELPAWCKRRNLNVSRIAPLLISKGVPVFRFSTNGTCGKNHFLKGHENWVKSIIKKAYAPKESD